MEHDLGDRRGRDDRRGRERRRLRLAMVASGAVHLAVFLVPWRGNVASGSFHRSGADAPWPAVEVVNVVVAGDLPSPPVVESLERPPTEVERSDVPVAPGSVAPGPVARPEAASAAYRLRSSRADPRLLDVPAAPLPDRAIAQGHVSGIIAATLARPPDVAGRDSLQLTTWGDDGGLRLAPGLLTVGGVALPFCGGPDAARCGFGVRPWDLERADREADLILGLEEQGRWESIQERAREVRRRADARRDSTSGGEPS